MRQLLCRQILVCFVVSLYLLGGHAMTHGLTWCLGIEGHSHLENSTGCATDQVATTCVVTSGCEELNGELSPDPHHKAECRHLPFSNSHLSGKVVRKTAASPGTTAIDQTNLPVALPLLFCPFLQQAIPDAAELPPLLAMTALRTTIILC
ncbi:MAG: hypothetical protein RQ754_16315 [Desulfuromonadales bacterium]|nr:hypothetical protein [Desulfuromonadales bacterium]